MSQRNPLRNPNLNLDFFTYLPSEIIIDILSRLPVRTIVSCKYVCKSWLHLVETHEFVKSHLSKSVPGLAICQFESQSKLCKFFEFEDGLDAEHHDLHYNPVTKFNFPYNGLIHGSADGLLFLRDLSIKPNALYICNPITRDYIQFHYPQEFVYSYPQAATYGFGVSKMTQQYKVVRIFHDCICDQETRELLEVTKCECQVYTLGTGSWRSIAPGPPFQYISNTFGSFLNGNLHWLAFDVNDCLWISCFDLETELFSTFSPPPLQRHEEYIVGVVALGDCLCLAYSSYDDIVIWSMKEYGDEKSWTNEFVICKSPGVVSEYYGVVYPIKVFKDGDILMALGDFLLFYYSKKNKSTQKIDLFEAECDISATLHTPSFFSLKSFGMENVESF